MSEDIILDIANVTKEFPGVKALSNVSFKVKKGEIHGLCGENGAGKSTLVKILSGVYEYGSYDGKVFMNAEELKLTGDSIKQAIKKGIAIVYQELALIPQMTVGENIFLGREPKKKTGVINWHKLYHETEQILNKYHLNVSSSEKICNLGVGQQQMVEIAKALSEDAKLLILDEPTSALTESEVDTLMGILKGLKASGVTCIYISHKLEEFFRISDSLTVLRDGMVVNTLPVKETNFESIISMMVGREMKERYPEGLHKIGKIIFEVKNLTTYDPLNITKKNLDNISFSVKEGEILGIAGLMGSGRTELVTAIFGEYGYHTEGNILVDNNIVYIKSARDAIKNKISLVPEDRKKLGLILNDSILNNITLPNLNQFSKTLRINKNKELRLAEKYIADLVIKISSILAPVDSLSGGNQQKVVVAKWLMSNPRILIMDEPTRGIDVGAKYEIYKLMLKLTKEGIAIIMVSSELPEIFGMCDRILVMYQGRCTGIVDKKEATQEKIMALATGINNLK